jgi:hypothetical protein
VNKDRIPQRAGELAKQEARVGMFGLGGFLQRGFFPYEKITGDRNDQFRETEMISFLLAALCEHGLWRRFEGGARR